MHGAAAMNGAVFETTLNVFVKLRFAKLYDAVITTPLEPEDVAAGELLWAVTRASIYGMAFVLVMAALGYVHYWAVVFTPLAIALISLSFGLIGLVFTAPDADDRPLLVLSSRSSSRRSSSSAASLLSGSHGSVQRSRSPGSRRSFARPT